MNYFDEPEDFSNEHEEWMDEVDEAEFPETIFDFDLNAFEGMYDEGRKRILFSMPESVDTQWRNFVETLTGEKIRRGTQSASSPLATLALRLLMAVVAEYEVENVVSDMTKLVGQDRDGLVRNLEKVIEVLNETNNI